MTILERQQVIQLIRSVSPGLLFVLTDEEIEEIWKEKKAGKDVEKYLKEALG